MSISSYTLPAWVDCKIQQGEISCHPPGEPVVKAGTRQYHTCWQVQSLARIWTGWLALAIPPPHAGAFPTHPGNARFSPCAVEVLPAPSELSPGCLFMPCPGSRTHCMFWCQTEECPCQPVPKVSPGVSQTLTGLDPRAAIP